MPTSALFQSQILVPSGDGVSVTFAESPVSRQSLSPSSAGEVSINGDNETRGSYHTRYCHLYLPLSLC